MKIESRYDKSMATEKGERIMITYILTKDSIGLYAVYVGIGSENWILLNGDKLSYEEAISNAYPFLEKKEYRR